MALLAGCGGGGGDRTTTTSPPQTAKPRPPLPRGWHRVVNPRGGFSLGLPAGWTARNGQGSTVVRSPDGSVSAGVSADRSTDGQSSSPLGSYARRTARELEGRYRGLRVGPARPVPGAAYPTATVTATGTFRATGVRQEIVVAVVRQPGQVTFSLVFFRNARVPGAAHAPVIGRIIRSFRAQPPEF